ncbi:type IV pilus assembly protein PilB [Sedimentibacter acidaminivorans]|uniref:Type IV pilus assembly protein PilB n=1 Tax=Sedimentibacter acidaminivorans TaxID=913099 RepID=A0ABS4GI51_9FIRM|nr:ATPase, T2SS/T4P/T4SS family [Sedimentibacter acidaminivorans]MBP1927339.1 type IV pilus assembly protein PilB [Sedimentibacter acidaminivorans]
MQKQNLKLGELLLYAGKISHEQLNEALEYQKTTKMRLGEIVVNKGWLKPEEIVDTLELQLGYPKVDLSKYEMNSNVATLIPESIVKKYKLIAIDKKDNMLKVAMVDPLNFFAIDDIKLYTKMDVIPFLASGADIDKVIERYYSNVLTQKALNEFSDTFTPTEDDMGAEEEMLEVASAPIVKLINSIIEQAMRSRASDIHIEPSHNDIRVRFRIDGDLKEIMVLPKSNLSAITTRIKIIGRMDIAEKRIPQDGRVEMRFNDNEIDLRISTLPTVYGEKIVIRILDKSNFNFTKEGLGFSQDNLNKLNNMIAQPYGMLLVTGPTGSGKSTTLYTILRELNVQTKNVITVEDPVEFKLKGINQVHVNPKAGLTFAAGLRSILRQDPDTIMIGEIRDSETAEIAVRAAITGHLVLSTLHTNDSPSTIARLIDMGLEPYLVSSAVTGIISQRLVKLLCPKCKQKYKASDSEKKILGIDSKQDITLHKPVGCNSCNNGYRGRAAVHEVMLVNENIRRLINKGANTDDIRRQALEDKMATLLQSSTDLALKGDTSFEEIMRAGYTLG